jgi:hypothetical protein
MTDRINNTDKLALYEKTLGQVADALRGSAIGLTPMNQKAQEGIADYIRMILHPELFSGTLDDLTRETERLGLYDK